MKKYILIITAIILMGIFLLSWQIIDKNTPHQFIEKEQISGVFLWTEATDIKPVSKENYSRVIDLFNDYDPDNVEQADFPLQSNAKLIIDLNTAKSVTISYLNKKIYVNRNDTKNGEYVFLDDANELEDFFKQLLE